MEKLLSYRLAPGSRIFARASALARPGHEIIVSRASAAKRNETRDPGATRKSVSRSIGGGNGGLLVPFADGIVAPDPVGAAVDAAFAGGDRFLLRRAVAHVLEARIGEGEPLYPVHARDPDAAKIAERLDRIAASLEPARENVGVLERLAGALPGIGQHGVGGVADELDAAAAPVLRKGPREQAPFRAFGDQAQKLRQARLGVREAQPHLVGIAARRPAFLDPFVRVLLGDDIHELLAADVIGEEMATRPDPLDMTRRLEHLLRHIAAVEQHTPYHLAGIGRVVVAVERLPDDRAHAIGADHDLGLDASAIGESERDTVAALLQSCEAVSQMNGAAIEPAREGVEQVGAVKGVIGSAVARRSLAPIVEFEELTGLHVARIDAGRRVGDGGDLVAEIDRSQRLDGLRADVDRGADLAQGRRRLEHLRRHAEGPQRVRGRKPGESAADDRDPAARWHSLHHTILATTRGGDGRFERCASWTL